MQTFLCSHEFTDSDEKSSDLIAVLNSFRAKIIRVKVNKKPTKKSKKVKKRQKTVFLDPQPKALFLGLFRPF